MKRQIIEINEDKCTGCGLCIPNCHEGALQIIDEKARLVSELMCDGLGACIGHCPEGAIEIVEKEAAAYDETKTIASIIPKGANTLLAHLKHLKDHEQYEYLQQGMDYLKNNKDQINVNVEQIFQHLEENKNTEKMEQHHHGGCPGSASMQFGSSNTQTDNKGNISSQLRQWPVQMHLINPSAAYFKQSDLLLAADCVAFAMGNFHQDYLKGKSLAIACPKLDSNKEIYIDKLVKLINEARVDTISVMMMEVPCCSGLLQLAKEALTQAERNVPVKAIHISVEGNLLSSEWI